MTALPKGWRWLPGFGPRPTRYWAKAAVYHQIARNVYGGEEHTLCGLSVSTPRPGRFSEDEADFIGRRPFCERCERQRELYGGRL